MKFNRRQIVLAAAMLAAVPMASNVMAQGYPAKPITIIVAYPAGGDTDAMARLYAEKLTHRLGQPVVIDNRPGASGVIGSAMVAKAAPDGYTLLMAPSTFAIAQLVLKTSQGSGYDVLNGFTPIVQTSVQPLFVASNQVSGITDVKGLVAKAKTGGLTYASPGSGSPMHILGELFNKVAGVKIDHVPYKGVAPAVNDLIGGHVPTTFMTYGPLAPYVGTKVNVLAVADSKRTSLSPNVPTLAELGYKGVEVTAWQGIFAPKGLPPEIAKLLNGHMNEILKMPDVVSKMHTFGALPAGGDSAQLGKLNADDYNRFGKLIKELGIHAD